jgi:hypothetical protein
MHRFLIFIPLLIFCVSADAQKPDGIWKGSLTLGPGGCFPVYNLELHINLIGNKVTGTSYHYSDATNFVKEDFDGSYDPASKILYISENRVITYQVPPDCVPCIKKYELDFSVTNKIELLDGKMGGVMMNNKGECPPGRISLSRIKESTFLNLGKKNELVREIRVDSGLIQLDFYDNGYIDGDIISVFVDNQVVISNNMLTAKPLTMHVKIDSAHLQREVIMVGENMGTIPPNTALMIITAGTKRYKLFLSADEKKNAMVRFVYQDPNEKLE